MSESADTTAPELIGEDGWTPLPMPKKIGMGRSFVSGDTEGDRLRVRYFRRESDGAMTGRVWFGPGAEGPPMHVHGGSMAAVLDEIMGGSAWMAGHVVVAAQITVKFRKMIPLMSVMTLEAWVSSASGRRVTTVGRIVGADGEVYAEGEGLFIELAADQFADLAGRAKAAWVKAQTVHPAAEEVKV